MKVIFIYILLLFSLSAENITIGTTHNYKNNLEKINQGQVKVSDIIGFEMNLIDLIARELKKNGDTVSVKNIGSKNRKDSLTEGVIDMIISSYSITPDRLLDLDFTTPYFENKGLSFIVRSDSDITNISDLNSNSKIGYIEKTTADTHLENKNWNKVKVDNISIALEKIKNNHLDAYIGDFIQLQYYARVEKNFKILNIIPTKQKDYYAIALKKDSPLTKKLNNILFNNMVKINILKNKWIDDSLYSYNQLNKINPIINKLQRTIIILLIISGVGFFMIFLWIYFVSKNKQSIKSLQRNLDTQIKTLKSQQKDMTKIQENTSKVIELIKVDILKKDGIIQSGIDIFKTAQKEIYYIGAAGFSSTNKEWLSALNNFIKNENTTLIRIVDLPKDGRKYFKEEEDYIHYLTWLIQRAAALEKFPSRIRLYTTRRAPLWSKGYIRIFKDNKSVLVFTGSRKSGNLIRDNVDEFHQTAQDMKSGGDELTKKIILEAYFKYSQYSKKKQLILDNIILSIQENFDDVDENAIRRNIRQFLTEK